MAKIPKGATIEINLPGGTATLTLREPTIEELNTYNGEKFNVPEGAERAAVLAHQAEAQAALFDLILTAVSGLEHDDDTPIGLDRKHLIPQEWKTEAIFRRFDRTPVSIKN